MRLNSTTTTGCLTRCSASPSCGPVATTTEHLKRSSEPSRSNPSAVIAYQFLGCVALFAGRAAQAVPALETVLHLDPQYQSRSLILADLSLSRLLLGDVDGADCRCGTDAVAREPENVRAHHRLVAALGYAASAIGGEGRAGDTPAVCSQTFPKRMSAPPIRFGSAEHLALFNEGLGGQDGKARSSKREERLDHRHPAIHTCGIRSKRPAIRSFVDPDQLGVEPQPLGRKEIPFDTTAVLMRVAKLSKDLGPAAIQHELLGNDKMTRRQLDSRGRMWM